MTDLFGSYRSQTTRGLQQINSSKYPDTNKNFEKNVQRLNQFVDYISQYLQTMQKGVDEANQDPISKMRSTITDLAVLLGGGELLYGINLGDLQYFLPALGAMFGFDSAQPFPLNLLYAAEHFFLGYIVPLDSWAPAVEDIIDAWAVAFGIPADFVASLHDLLDAIQSITSDYLGLFNALWGILSIFGTLPGIDQGPFGDLWHTVSTLLGGTSLTALGSLVDPVFHGLAPWIETLANLLNDFDQVLQAFTGGIVDITGLVNLGNMFTPYINLLSGFTTPLAAWGQVFAGALTSSGVPALDASKITTGTFAASLLQPLIDAISQGFGGSSGLNFTSLQGFIGTIPSAQAVIDKLVNTLTGDSATGHTLTDLVNAFLAFPAHLVTGALIGSNIPNLDASKLTTGTLLASLIPALTSGWGKTIDASLIIGAVTSAASVAVTGITGLATGIGTWLASGGALPAATTILGSALTSAISSGNVPGLDATKIITGQLAQARATWAAQQDILAAAWGGTTGMTNSQFQSLAAQIPGTSVNGMFGAANIEAAVQAYLDSHVQGLTGIDSLFNQGTAQVQAISQQIMQFLGFNYSNPAAPQSGSVAAQSNANNANLNNRAVQKPPYANIDPTTDATFEFKEVWQNATASTIAITQAGGAVLGDITVRDGGLKQAVTWYGYPTGGTLANITGFFINLYSINLTTNVRTLVYQTPNIVASVVTGTTPKFNSYAIPAANYLNTAGTQGVKYTAEIAIVGTGTYNLVGQTIASWVEFHPTYGLHGESRPFNQFDNTTSVSSGSFGTTPGSLSTTMNIDARSTILVVHATALRTVGTATPAMTMTVGTGGSQKTLTAAAQFSYTDTRGYLFQQWAFVVTNPPTGTAIPMQLNQNTSGITWGLSFGALSYIGPNGYGTPQFNSGSGTSGSLVATNGTIGGWNTVSFTAGGATIASGTATTGYTSRTQQNTGAASAPIVVGDAPGSASNTFTEGINSGSTGWGILVLPLTTNPPSTFTPATGASTQANPVVYSHVVPWIGLSGVAATPVYQPVTKTINSGIGQSFDPATFAPWANYVDVMQWADGSAGAPGSPTNSGAGGGAGGAQVTTLSKSQFISGAWTLDVGTGGTNVAAAQQNRVVIPGYGTRTVAGAGPQVASGSINQGDTGANGATISYTDAHGVAQSYGGGSGGVGPTGNGGAPGAGGSGGAVFWYGSGTPGNGGPGMTLLRFYQ